MTGNAVEFNGKTYIRNPKSKYYFEYTTRSRDRKNAKQLHRAVWAYYNGDIPEGYHIHHKDGNIDNNDITNLECLSPAEHHHVHEEMHKKDSEYVACRAKSIKAAGEKAKEWHKSEAGHEWHKEHAVDTICKVRENRVEKMCCVCGSLYSALPWQMYCSKECANAARLDRRRKFTPEERECAVCGKAYIANKANARFCGAKCKAADYRKRHTNA